MGITAATGEQATEDKDEASPSKHPNAQKPSSLVTCESFYHKQQRMSVSMRNPTKVDEVCMEVLNPNRN